MTSHAEASKELIEAEQASNRLQSVLGRDTEPLFGHPTPRIHTPLNDLPSRGLELVDLAGELKIELMDWQKFFIEHSHKVLPNGSGQAPSMSAL